MRHLIPICISFIMLSSCQKQMDKQPSSTHYLETVKVFLKDSIAYPDYSLLDFSKPVFTKVDSAAIYILRIPIKGKDFKSDFVLVKTDARGNVEKGRFIHLKRTNLWTQTTYDGTVSIKDLSGNLITASSIEKGFIKVFHRSVPLVLQRAPVEYDPYVVLPEVVIVSTYNTTANDFSYSTWVSLMSFFNDGGSSEGYYGYLGGSGSSYPGGTLDGGGYYGGGGSNVSTAPTIKIDFENQYDRPAINVTEYMRCFSSIPDAGATCSIEIFADIPVNDDPNKYFDWENGSPGHVFIQLKKSNSQQSISQNIGFYPKSGWKTTITPAPIAGKFVDNHHHEFNASYKVNLTAAQLQTAIISVLYLAGSIQYDIDDNNCTDWALNIFNDAVRPEQELIIPLYKIPGGEAPLGTSTPQGLYKKLQQMKAAGGVNAANINLPLVDWAGASKGPCN